MQVQYSYEQPLTARDLSVARTLSIYRSLCQSEDHIQEQENV